MADRRCPTCGESVSRVTYGYPTQDAADAVARGELALGGCMPPITSPRKARWTCGDHGPFIIDGSRLIPDPDVTVTLQATDHRGPLTIYRGAVVHVVAGLGDAGPGIVVGWNDLLGEPDVVHVESEHDHKTHAVPAAAVFELKGEQ